MRSKGALKLIETDANTSPTPFVGNTHKGLHVWCVYWAGSPVNDWLGPGRRALYTPNSTLDTLHNHHPFESKQGAPPPSPQKNYNPRYVPSGRRRQVRGPTTRVQGWRGVPPLRQRAIEIEVVGCIRGGYMSTSNGRSSLLLLPPHRAVNTLDFYASGRTKCDRAPPGSPAI